MSNDTGSKRSIDDIQDGNDAQSEQVRPQHTNNEHDVTDTNNNDTGVSITTTATTIAAGTAVGQASTIDERKSSLLKTQERKRGQRMFGMLMGTLDKFDKTEKQNIVQARKRQAIDTKHQERLLEEKMAIQASMLQHQQERAKEHQQRLVERDEKRMKQNELQRKRLAHYLITSKTPHLSYLPKILLPQQQEQIDRQIDDAESTRSIPTATSPPPPTTNEPQ